MHSDMLQLAFLSLSVIIMITRFEQFQVSRGIVCEPKLFVYFRPLKLENN